MSQESKKERRTLTRFRPYYYLRVFDSEVGDDCVGSVYDISRSGMRLVADRTFDPQTRYEFAIPLPEGSFFGTHVSMTAECRWCRPGVESHSYEAGFQFRGQPSEGLHSIKALLKDLEAKGQL